MVARLGISILDLLPQTTDLANFVPDEAVERLGVLTVVEHRSTTSAEFSLHSGTLQALADILDIDAGDAAIKIPGLTQGLPFRLALRRGAVRPDGQEGPVTNWTLDVSVSNVEILLPGLQAARQAGGSGLEVLHLERLEPDPDNPNKTKVFLIASGVLRFEGAVGLAATVQLIDSPDPFDPTTPTGAVVRLTSRPPHFFFGGSQYGLTLDRFAIDLSRTFTPADVVARGHDETWRGVAFKEATFYAPPDTPLVPNLSISTRDVIVGDPGGLQGELRIEWGADFADQFNTHITILRKNQQGDDVEVAQTVPTVPSTALEYGIDESAAGMTDQARARFGVGDAIPGHTDLGIVGVWWKLPDGSEGNSATAPYFTVPSDGELHYKLRIGDPGATFPAPQRPSQIPEGQTELMEVTVRFPRTGAPKPPSPLIDAVISGATYRNVVHLRGPRQRLAGVVLHARRAGNPVDTDWTLGTGSAPTTAAKKPTFTLPMLTEGVIAVDVVAAAGSTPRRVRLEVVRTGPLVIGHQTGVDPASPSVVSVAGESEVPAAAVVDTFEAASFHATADRRSAAVSAELAPPNVTVPTGAVAEVELPLPVNAGDPIPPPTSVQAPTILRAIQLLFNFAEPEVSGAPVALKVVYPLADDSPSLASDPQRTKHLEAARPIGLQPTGRSAPAGNDIVAQLRDWIAKLGLPNQRKYLVVGRTDDLKYNNTQADNRTYNDGLAGRRRDAAVTKLKAAGVAAADIITRIETAAPPALPSELSGVTLPARFTQPGRLALPDSQVQKPPGATRPVWNSSWTQDVATAAGHATAIGDSNRVGYRCADIYAIDAVTEPEPPPPLPPADDIVPTRILVPGPDGPPPPKIPSTETTEPPIDYRVRLRAKWDSPTIVTYADTIPTEAEILVAWKAAVTELPATSSSGGAPGTIDIPPPTGPDFWEAVLRFAYDARTEQTQVDGSLALPDGVMTFRSASLAGAMAFGPAIMALVDPADVSEGVGDEAENKIVLAAAIIAIGAGIGDALNSGSGPESTVDIDKFSISYRWNGDSRVSATVDYTVDLRVDVDLIGDSFLAGRIKLRYKGVGLRFDSEQSGLASVGITYDDLSVEVADPGQWTLGGPLGNLIRVAASRIGNGSSWMELDLEFALDLGVVRLEGATIRITLEPFSVELRGLTAVINVPGVIEGKGSVTVGGAGAIRALLAVQVIPARLGAYGALAVDQDFVAVEIGVQFPVGIPLANTGLGLFGLMGRFVANGARNLDGLTNADPVQRELDWYARPAEQKYTRRSGQFAVGLGAIIGTLPDDAFTFNAEGSIALGFPDVSVLLGIDAHLLQQRKPSATESSPTTTGVLRILGMTLFEPSAVMVGVRATYEIPKVLRVNIPFSAFYPLASSGLAWFIRLGTDNHPDRPGNPITVTIFPELLDVKAWAFIMIEERQLHGLGGTLVPPDFLPPLDFDGYSIGVGAGFELRYKAGPFKLEIGAFLLVGAGTKPMLFAGAAGVRGELDLAVVSVGVDGLVHFHVNEELHYLKGHFCGHVSFFFFSVSGCVDIHFGDPIPIDIPKPASPLIGIDLCDHLSAVKGSASQSATGTLPTVWPDTVAVLKFQHYVEDALGNLPATQFRRLVTPPAALSPWSGSTELKYTYRLTRLELFKLTGGNPNSDSSWTAVFGPFDSAWWLPSHRRALVTGGTGAGPSTEEGRELGLFHWDPRAWSRWLGEGSQDLPGDPAGSVGQACEEPARAEPSCALGQHPRASIDVLAAFDAKPRTGAVFPSRFTAMALPASGFEPEAVAALAGDVGWTYRPAIVVPLHGAVNLHGEVISRGWRLPSVWQGSRFVFTAPTTFHFSKPLVEGEVTLEVCLAKEPVNPKPTGACDRMPTEPREISAFTGTSGTRYRSTKPMLATRVDGQPALVLQAQLIGVPPNDVSVVRLELLVAGKTKVAASNRDGNVVVEETLVPANPPDQITSVLLAGPGIVRITIDADGPTAVVLVCWGPDEQPLVNEAAEFPVSDLPLVFGVTRNNKRVALEPKPVPVVDGERDICPKFVYPFDELGTANDDGWIAVEIAAFRRGEVALVAICGVTVEARQAQAADGDFRQSLVGLLSGLTAHFTTNEPTRTIQLEDNTTYQLRATWEYQGFRPSQPGEDAAPPTAAGWLAGNADRFTFRTAAFGTAPAPLPAGTASLATDPAQGGPGYDERVFDPRGLARYVMASVPDHEDPPHFLDDRVGFWFSVDHLASLVDHYDRVLLVKVLRTDPPAGSQHDVPPPPPGGHHPLDVTIATHFSIEALTWFAADHRFVVAAEEAPCLGTAPPLGSSSISVDADLRPRCDYDLLLTVAPKVVGANPEVVVARNHFSTSRFRNPSELLAAVGFRDPIGPTQPFDAIATAGVILPSGPAAISDELLDDLIGQLGLDPWPLPASPRTSIVWSRPTSPASPWTIIGALVEADEPIVRRGFATGAVGEPVPPSRSEVASLVVRRITELLLPPVILPGRPPRPPQTVRRVTPIGTLTERVRNAAGTRVLFLAAAPIAMTGGLSYDLRMTMRERGVTGAAGSIPIYDRPLLVFQEGE